MDGAEQDQHEAHLKEVFNSFDATGSGSLGQEELIKLCQLLNIEEVIPALQQILFQDNLLGKVYFDQFKEALIVILSRTLSFEEHFEEPVCLPQAQPKYIKDGKCYGRRSLPEFQEPLGANEIKKFWNPDDLNASQRGSSPIQAWIDNKLNEVCKDLGLSQDAHLNKKKLISICEQYDLKNVNKKMFEDVFHDLEPDGTMSVKDFFYGLFKNGTFLTTSASTPYRQLKRHLSMQSFDESGRRSMTSSAITSSISFRLFSCLDDGMGYGSLEQILDTWNEEGIENGQEILKALDFSLDGSINLMELTLALENELLITKNDMHQAALASFKTEIRHLLEQIDQVAREKEKLQSDLEKAEKLKSLMASEVDDHHAAIEHQYEYNLRKLEDVYKERIASFKSDIQKEKEQILQQIGKQHLELEQEIEKVKTEENCIRDRLALSLKENSRLESELLENAEKLAEYESLVTKLQKNLVNVLSEKFGDLDPNSAEYFLQEESLTKMKTEYEQQCRMLQDQVDELQSELEKYRAHGKILKFPFKNFNSEEFDVRRHSIDLDQGFSSENCNPLNMSIEAELIIEQLKEQHHSDMKRLTLELTDKMLHYEKQLDETKSNCEKEQENVKQKYKNEIHVLEKEISGLKSEIEELQKQTVVLKKEQQQADYRCMKEKNELQVKFNEEKAHLQEKLKLEHEVLLKNKLEQVKESFNQERETLIQNGTWAEEKLRDLVKAKEEEKYKLEEFYQEKLKSLLEKHNLEKEELQRILLEKHQNNLQEERQESERFQEENSILRNEITTLNEEGSISSLKLREIRGSQEEIWKKIETVRKEKNTIKKMVGNFKKQVLELKAKNQHLVLENAELIQKNTQNEADLQYLQQHLAQILCQKEKEIGNCTLEVWEKENTKLKEELDNYTSSDLVCSLEAELSKIKIESHALEQENFFLKDELERIKQVRQLSINRNHFLLQRNHKQLAMAMEERMIEVEEKLKLVKRLLQEKVNQLKEQICKNTKSDAVVKDIYVDNIHLLRSSEMTEQWQKTAEKKNCLLEEKIASLSNIIRNLTPAPVTANPLRI
uniref:Ninein n=1 Tax=Monodelphis domestica TaxID=13616 RepID=F7B068_MONDO